jgi:Bacterial Ig domain
MASIPTGTRCLTPWSTARLAEIGVQQDESLAALLDYLNVPVPDGLRHPDTQVPPPSNPPKDTSILGRLRQAVNHTFFNHAPSVGYDVNQNTQGLHGVVTGALDGSDADGDELTYQVIQGPANGTVLIHADGTFTYTPSNALANNGGTDSFVVAVNDGADPLNLHAILGPLMPAGSEHTTSTTITVPEHAPNTGITVIRDNVNRLDIIVDDSYADFRAQFEAAVPPVSPQVLAILGAGVPNYDALVAATNANATYGFIKYNTIDSGPMLTVAGYPADATHAVHYLVGNHLFAEEMYRENRSTQLYAPLRMAIFEAPDGTVHFVIDQPSTRFDSFDDPQITAVGQMLDEKIANLLTILDAPIPDVLQ